jgi:hypothetical protein
LSSVANAQASARHPAAHEGETAATVSHDRSCHACGCLFLRGPAASVKLSTTARGRPIPERRQIGWLSKQSEANPSLQMRDLKTVFVLILAPIVPGQAIAKSSHFGIFSRLTHARESFAYYAISEQCPRLGFGDNGVNLIANKINHDEFFSCGRTRSGFRSLRDIKTVLQPRFWGYRFNLIDSEIKCLGIFSWCVFAIFRLSQHISDRLT